jgi:hypothetical protein
MEHFWIVPIIAIAVWILSSLIRPEEKAQRNPLRPRRWPNEDRGGMDQPSRPVSEVDRFLEEINKLRKKAEEERPAEVVEVPRPAPPRLQRPKPVVEVVLPASIPTLPPVVVEVLEVLPVAVPPAAPVVQMPASRPSPAVSQVRAMLRTPQAVRTAILLQAVLGPPRCRKRYP